MSFTNSDDMGHNYPTKTAWRKIITLFFSELYKYYTWFPYENLQIGTYPIFCSSLVPSKYMLSIPKSLGMRNPISFMFISNMKSV